MVAVFSQRVFFPKSFFEVSGALVIGTGLFTPVVFFIIDYMREAFFEERANN